MKVSDIKNKDRVISELLLFIRKVLVEPEICEKAMEIARKHQKSPNAKVLIADELASTTNVKIPVEHCAADTLFLELLIEVVKDETALY